MKVYQIQNGKADKYHLRENCRYIRQCRSYRECDREVLGPKYEACSVCADP